MSRGRMTICSILACAMVLTGLAVPTTYAIEDEEQNLATQNADAVVREDSLDKKVVSNTLVSNNNESTITIDSRLFPDDVFRSYIKQEFDVDKNGKLDIDERNNATVMYITGVSSLKGVEVFSHLKDLRLYAASPSFTAVDFSYNTDLAYLFLGSTALKELDLSNNYKISTVNISNSSVEKLILPDRGGSLYLYAANSRLAFVSWPEHAQVNHVDLSGTPLVGADFGDERYIPSIYYIFAPLAAREVFYDPAVGEFNLQEIAPDFDSKRVSNVRGAELSGSVVKNLKGEVTLRYVYETGIGAINPVVILKPTPSITPVKLVTVEETMPPLPETVRVNYWDGRVEELSVSWDMYPWGNSKPGTIFLHGRVSSLGMDVTAEVTVLSSYTVRFDSCGGSKIAVVQIADGSTIAKPLEPVREGYTFEGWYTKSQGGERYDFSQPVTRSLTLYAHWAISIYKVTFDANGGSSVASQSVSHGSTASMPANPVREGYSVEGWYTAPSGGEKYDFSLPVTSDITLYAHWSVSIYTVQFDTTGGSPIASQSVSHGSGVSPSDIPHRRGYWFEGWYTAAEGGELCYFPYTITSDITLYARWSEYSHIVTFDPNDGSPAIAQSVRDDFEVDMLEEPSRAGYTFEGWYTAAQGGEKYDFSQPVKQDLTLYAHWKERMLTIVLDANGGSMGYNKVTVRYGSPLTTIYLPSRTGFAFIGWYTAVIGGDAYDFAQPLTEDTTFYAHWKLDFKDVVLPDSDNTGGTPHAADIEWLAATGITTGYSDGTFRGMTPVYRQDMAAFLRRLAVKNNIGDAADWVPTDEDWNKFRDVNENTPHAEDILWLAHAGISEGWKEADGTYTFRGMNTVVRQDMAAFLRRLAIAANKDDGVTPKTDFTDVSSKTPHYQDVQWLGGSGVTEGYLNSDGKTRRYEGMTSVYRQDMAAFLHRLDALLNK